MASLGQFRKRLRELPYEHLFHLFLVIDTAKGKYILEKNEVISMSKFVAYPDKSDQMNVMYPADKELTFNTLLATTREHMGEEKFFRYVASTNNCQVFCNDNLKFSGLGTPAEKDFIIQDSKLIFKNSPVFAKLCDEITDGAAIGNRYFQEAHDEGNNCVGLH